MGLLRLILALSVVIAHTSPIFGLSLTGGKVAVQAFFIISGYYMSMILNEKYIGENKSYWLFLSNRFMRLFPVYWVVLGLTVAFSFAVDFTMGHMPFLDTYAQHIDGIGLFSLFYLVFTNFFVFGQDVILFLGLDTRSGSLFFTPDFWKTDPKLYTFLLIPQGWTIGLELTFYLVAPFLLRRKTAVILLLVLLSLVLRFFLYHYGLGNDPWNYRFFPTELAFFLLGNFSYTLYKRIKGKEMDKRVFYAAFIYMLTFSLFYNLIPGNGHVLALPFASKEILYFTSMVFLLPLIFQGSKYWKVDRYIGELSYPVYISHMLVVVILTLFFEITHERYQVSLLPWLAGASIVCTLAVSVLLNEVVAKKMEALRQRRLRSKENRQLQN